MRDWYLSKKKRTKIIRLVRHQNHNKKRCGAKKTSGAGARLDTITVTSIIGARFLYPIWNIYFEIQNTNKIFKKSTFSI